MIQIKYVSFICVGVCGAKTMKGADITYQNIWNIFELLFKVKLYMIEGILFKTTF